MQRLGLALLAKIEFPTGDVRLTDGGFLVWNGETYRDRHATFGTVGSIQALSEGTGAQVPALELTLLPPGTVDAADLSDEGFQTSRARFWIAEFDLETHTVTGTPDLQFDGQVDQTIISAGADGGRDLAISVVSTAERLFARNAGNTLNPTWHKSIWTGETGHDNATGLVFPVAWGVESPNGGATSRAFFGTDYASVQQIVIDFRAQQQN